ncbi:hypothetical protein LTR86_004627 [Recurvomyces mirabilis]|nr:hypothetical protein LTR86_004627 [Recurvomyces mirabilis]
MPRQQVYGKRSRAVYNDFAIFDSPQRPTVKSRAEEPTQRLVEKVTGLSLYDCADVVEHGRRRLVLGACDANSVVLPVTPRKTKNGRRKKVAEVEVIEEHPGPEGASEVESREDVEAIETIQAERRANDETAGKEEPKEQQDLLLSTEAPRLSPEPPKNLTDKPDDTTTTTAVPINNIYSNYSRTLLDLSSHDLTPFALWSSQLSDHFSLAKIAEASFGEVYRLSLLSPLPGLSRADESVFKVIALQAPKSILPIAKKARAAALAKAEAMSKVEDVASEVRVLQRMSSIPGFTNFRDVRIVQGRPPPLFVEAFQTYNAEQKAKKKDLSHFPDPTKKTSYCEDQLWAVIEMQDAGTDLERLVEAVEGECTSIWSVWDVFWQIVLTLAKGEEGAEFEHRDLHLGNICVRHKNESTLSASTANIDTTSKKLGFTDLETTIIDYTISRCRLTSKTHPFPDPEQEIAYHDLLPDPSLFQGDSTEEYQYDIYRYMRGAVYAQDPMSNQIVPNPLDPDREQEPHQPGGSGEIWRSYHPTTNLIWLHFILYKLLKQLSWPSSQKQPSRKLKGVVNPAFAKWKRANDLEHTLLHMQNLLDPETGICKNTLRSASDVVALALSEGWLGVEDVVGSHSDVCTGMTVGRELPSSPPTTVNPTPDDTVGVPQSSDPPPLTSEDAPTHIQINIDIMEEKGLEAATHAARKTRRKDRARRRRSTL